MQVPSGQTPFLVCSGCLMMKGSYHHGLLLLHSTSAASLPQHCLSAFPCGKDLDMGYISSLTLNPQSQIRRKHLVIKLNEHNMVNSENWWWTWRPGMLRFMGVEKSWTRLSDWTELNTQNSSQSGPRIYFIYLFIFKEVMLSFKKNICVFGCARSSLWHVGSVIFIVAGGIF